MPPKRRQEPGSSEYYLNDSEPGSSGYYFDEYDLTAASKFKRESPSALAFTMGAEIVDQERARLVEALQAVFSARMDAIIASTGVDRDDFVEATIALRVAKANLKEELKDIYNNLDIDDAGLRLNLIEINSTLNSIQPESIDETISNIVNKLIPTSEIVLQAERFKTLGGKTNRKHKTNKKHKTNRRKHKTNRRKHRKTRKN